MNKDFKDKWVNALESEEYDQGTQFLNKNNKFCCLGVACDLLEKEGILKADKANEGGVVGYGDSRSRSLLPKEATDYMKTSYSPDVFVPLDFEEEDIPLRFKGTKVDLSSLNDSGVSFKTIAKLIKQGL